MAMPFLLKAGDPDLSTTQAETSLPDVVPASARLEVVADVPTLRDYRDRLRDLVAKDPFQQHFTAPQVQGAQLGPGTSPTYDVAPTPAPAPAADLPSTSEIPTYIPPPPAPAPSPAPAPTPAPIPPATGGGDNGGGGNSSPAVRVETKLLSYRITARMGEPGEMKVRRSIPELTMLPNEKNPIAVFLGVSGDEEKALFLVSSTVTSTFGDTHCRLGDDACQLIAVERGFPVTFVYGPKDKKFRISINKIERVEQAAGSSRSSRDAGTPTRVGASASVDG
jgi:hypothetical protein